MQRMRRDLSQIVALAATFLAGASGESATLNNLEPVQDTYVLQNAGQSNFGNNTTVLLGDVGCTTCAAVIFLQYDLSSIPANATLNSATLSFQKQSATHSGDLAVSLRHRRSVWNESTVTWNSSDPDADPLVGSALIDTDLAFPVLTDGVLKTIVAGWIAAPGSNRGLSIYPGAASGSTISFYSKESSTGAPIRLSVNYSLPEYTLSVTRAGSGSGTVSSSPSGINCGSDCSESYASESQVTLTATASNGSTFTGWSGSCSGTGFCEVTMSSARSVTATFTSQLPGNGLCYIDTTCSVGNQRRVRDSGSGGCVDVTSCTALWKCSSGPVTGNCGGGSQDCTFSPGCGGAAQDCFNGICTSASTCTDRIKFQGYAFNPNSNQCSCSGAPPAAGDACVTAPTPDPSWLRVTTVSQTRLDLLWDESSANEDGFKIERKEGCCGPWTEIATLPANTTIYQSIGLTCNTAYAYRVWAYNAAGNSGKTNEAGSTTVSCSAGTVPTPAPSWLRVTPASSTQINLQWDDNSANEDGFKVERKQGCCGPWQEIATLPMNTTTYQSTGLTCGTGYAYRVWAFNATGNSGTTNEAAATTPSC